MENTRDVAGRVIRLNALTDPRLLPTTIIFTMMGGKVKLPSLTLEQERQVQSLGAPCLSQDMIQLLLDDWRMSWHSFKRRARKSKLDVKFAYSWTEFLANSELHSVFNKNNLHFKCPCGVHHVCMIRGFALRKHQVPVCDKCYHKQFSYDATWRANNSAAQLVAQNKPATLEKQRIKQTARHARPGMREKYVAIAKQLWANKTYREKVIRNSSISMAGEYKTFTYQSSIELAFILWCEETGRKIRNYDGVGIPYQWNNSEHRYFPDFIVEGNLIVEIKGHGSIYEKHRLLCNAKDSALKVWCKENGYHSRLMFDTDLPKRLIKQARHWHKEHNGKNRSKDTVPLPR